MKLLKEIRQGNIANVYLFYGEEDYKRKVYKNELKKSVPYGNQMNYAFFEGKDVNLQAVYDSVVTLPFFAEKRLVIVENSGKFKAGKKEEAEPVNDEMLERILEDLPETTCLAFFEEAVLKTRKTFKKIKTKGVVEECAEDKPEEIKKWIVKGFRSYHMQIEPKAVNLLYERVGSDYTSLLHEIEKLASYASGKEQVTVADVDAVTTLTVESRIFQIMDFMSMKNTKAVLDRYYDMLANKEDPRMILAMIRRQFRIMLQVEELALTGLSNDEIAGMTKNRDFVVRKMRSYLKNYNRQDILHILDLINRTDMQSKNGELDDQLGVELLVISICRS